MTMSLMDWYEHFPDGQDVEVFKFSVLKKAWENAKLKSELEHVTPYIRNNSDGKGVDIIYFYELCVSR